MIVDNKQVLLSPLLSYQLASGQLILVYAEDKNQDHNDDKLSMIINLGDHLSMIVRRIKSNGKIIENIINPPS